MTTTGLPGLWPTRKQRRRRIAALTALGPPSGATIPHSVSACGAQIVRPGLNLRLGGGPAGEARSSHTDRPPLGRAGGKRRVSPPSGSLGDFVRSALAGIREKRGVAHALSRQPTCGSSAGRILRSIRRRTSAVFRSPAQRLASAASRSSSRPERWRMMVDMSQEVANALRAEADRLDNVQSNYTGWQAVQASLRQIADSLEASTKRTGRGARSERRALTRE
jgi:hypothetical protein